MAIHAAMIHRVDVEIGKVLDQLQSMGAWEDTLVLFLSDNGASAEYLIRGDGHDPSAAPGTARFHGVEADTKSEGNGSRRVGQSSSIQIISRARL